MLSLSKQRVEQITSGTSTVAGERAARFLPLVALLFAGSGASALIYEIVWYQLLQLAIGSTAVSLGVLLATFMGGLAIGSLMLPRLLKQSETFWHPLRTYAAIEFAIAALGLIELVLVPLVGRFYLIGPQTGFAGILLRGLFAAILLLPPTMAMGASLPAIARWIEGTTRGVSWWGLLYGANTAGAVAGCLIAGFYLLRLYDVNIATFAAVLLNLGVALVSFLLAAHTPSRLPMEDEDTRETPVPTAQDSGFRWTIYLAIAFSGATALGAEVVWTRLMGLMLGATVYVFSLILAVFLAGLAMGTAAASMLAGQMNPRLALGWCQMLAAAGIAWTASAIADQLPYWPINSQLATDPIFIFQIDLARVIWAVFPATLFWGASFPLAFAARAARSRDSGATVGGIYAANTAGAIAGALYPALRAAQSGKSGSYPDNRHAEHATRADHPLRLGRSHRAASFNAPCTHANAGAFDGRGCRIDRVSRLGRAQDSRRTYRLWPPHGDDPGHGENSLYSRGAQHLHRHIAME